jgi:hypothetical protein
LSTIAANNLQQQHQNVFCNVELWDFSGDSAQQIAAIADESSALICVLPATDNPAAAEEWYQRMLDGRFNPQQPVLIILAHSQSNSKESKIKLSM